MKFKILNILLFFILFTGVAINGTAQHRNLGKINSEKKIAGGISFSPDYSFRYLSGSFPESNIKNWRNEFEMPTFGFTAGITFLYHVNPCMNIESGLKYSEKGWNTVFDKSDFYFPEDNIYTNPADDPWIPERAITKNRYAFLNVPVKVNWIFYKRKVDFFLSAGLSANLFLDATIANIQEFKTRTEKQIQKEEADFYPVNMAFIAGAGMDYSFSNQFRLRIEPEFRHSFTPMVDTSLKDYPYSVGINLALFYGI